LHHPHIVPIHAVGNERGVHYYAMQLIEGKSLADAIVELRGHKETRIEDGGSKNEDREAKTEDRASRIEGQAPLAATTADYKAVNETPRDARRSSILHPPSSILISRSSIPDPPSSVFKSRSPFFRRVAELGIEATDALGHAHRLGIIHRDVKPANLLLDEQGKLWVTDFGLALVQHNMDLTATGDMLGTLRYMSPEQASSQRGLIDQRTDIYSLGATLYELLTLQPAFPEKDRNELLSKIATHEPRLPRRLNPAIPKDLETIVLKSMAKNPQERYLTAEDLAEDLKRFLDDRPIRATRPSLAERAMKWSRRHKALVAVAVLLAFVTSISAAVIFFERERQTQETLQTKMREEQRLNQEKRRLIATVDVAQKALYELSFKPTMDRLLKNRDPQGRLHDQESLRKALAYCQQIADLNGSTPEIRVLSALSNRQAGQMFEALGELNEAQEAYGKAIATFENVINGEPGELAPFYRRDLANCRNRLGGVLWTNSKTEQAERTVQKQLEELEQLVADYPTNPDFRQDLANCRINLSLFFQVKGYHQKAEEILLENQLTLQKLASEFPCLPYVQKTLAANFFHLGMVCKETGRRDKSERAFHKAIELLEPLTSRYPNDELFQVDLANVSQNLGLVLRELGRFDDSEKVYKRSITLSEKLVENSPLNPDQELQLAIEEHQLALTLFMMKRWKEAEPLYRKASSTLERLVKDFKAKHLYQVELASCSHNFGLLMESAGKLTEAEEALVRASNLRESLANSFPSVIDYQNDLGESRYNQARILAKRNKIEDACEIVQQAIYHELLAAQKNPRNPQYLSSLWAQYLLLLELLVENKKPDQVKSVLKQAQAQCKDLPTVLNNFAWLMVIQPKPPVGDAQQGLEFAKLAVAKAPENGELWNTLGVAHYRAGNWSDAVNALNQSRTLRRGGDSYDFFFLAMAHWHSGAKDEAKDWYKKALAALPKKGNPELTRIHEEAKKLMEPSLIPVDKAAANPK